jgi:hypothetical protein
MEGFIMSSRNLSRRALTAGVPALAVAAALPQPAAALPTAPDPIFAAIESHRQAYAELVRVLAWRTQFEEGAGVRRWWYSQGGRAAPAGTDATNVDVEMAVNDASDAAEDAAFFLLEMLPSTAAGAAALLRYSAKCAEAEPDFWPDRIVYDDADEESDGVDWHVALAHHVADALEAIASGSAS